MMLLFLFICIFYSTYIHSITFIQYIHPSPFAEVPLHLLIATQLSGKNLLGVPSRESNSGLPCSKPTHYQLSYPTPFLSYAAPFLSYVAPLLSYAAPLLSYAAIILGAPPCYIILYDLRYNLYLKPPSFHIALMLRCVNEKAARAH
jgi:hypothetical protein